MSSTSNTDVQKLRNVFSAELQQILKDHRRWNDSDGKEGKCADLSGADLSRANLSGAYLYRAYLSRAYLSGAYLSGANLSRADLSNANLSSADLSSADLSSADLSGAYLSGAILSGANLSRAILSRADLSRADLTNVQNLPDFQRPPKEGASFTAFKKVCDGYVLELLIPAEAKRVSSTGTKCRASKAKVVRAFNAVDGTEVQDSEKNIQFRSLWAADRKISFVYKVGEEVSVENDFSDDIRVECAPGIHFFLSFEEARDYTL